jgi:hypothetical protein
MSSQRSAALARRLRRNVVSLRAVGVCVCFLGEEGGLLIFGVKSGFFRNPSFCCMMHLVQEFGNCILVPVFFLVFAVIFYRFMSFSLVDSFLWCQLSGFLFLILASLVMLRLCRLVARD